MVEYLRQLPKEQLVRNASSLTDPRMALQQAVLEGKEEAEIVRRKEEVLCQHLNKSLKAWMEWNEAGWNVGGASDTHSSRESLRISDACYSVLVPSPHTTNAPSSHLPRPSTLHPLTHAHHGSYGS